jgi:hypothetical protein
MTLQELLFERAMFDQSFFETKIRIVRSYAEFAGHELTEMSETN